MREELINECLELKAKILSQCKYIVEKEPSCKSVMDIAINNIDTPQNSESAIREMQDAELQALIEKFKAVLSKTETTIAKVNIALDKTNVQVIDEKKRKKELMIQAIFNRLCYYRYRILNLFGIEIK